MPVFRVPATITWPGAGSPGVNVWSVRTAEASVVVDELDAACSALKAFYDALAAELATGTRIEIGPDIVDRESQEDQSRPAKVTLSTETGGMSPPHLAVVVGWRTSLRARRGMGRTFIGPLGPDAPHTDGTPHSAVLTPINAAATALLEASDSATGWAVGCWGLESPGAYDEQGVLIPGQPHVHRDFTSFKVRDQFAVLRSRRD